MFVYCVNCDWSQDDFWDKKYNPAKSLQGWEPYLLGISLDEQCSNCSEFVAENGPITIRDILARQFEYEAQIIREMKWRTFEEFEKDPEKKCPNCGACGRENWNIDWNID